MNKIVMALGTIALAIGILGNSGCDVQPTATQVEARKQEQLTQQGVQQVGMPAIINFQEKRVLKQILELRDTKIVTITYIVDMNGKLHKICDSIGYGIPYATQYTNPQQDIFATSSSTVHFSLPQADPNGLYSPASAEGTWVLCSNPNKPGDVSPLYIEPRIIVSTFPLSVN